MKISGIYKIQSIIKPERIYIGSAVKINERWWDHRKTLRKNKHHSPKLQRHYNKYGEEDLQFSIIEPCLPVFLTAREQYYIDSVNPFFNICKVAGSTLGIKYTDESKDKLRRLRIGKTPWNKGLHVGNGWKGRKHSEETKQKIKQKKLGRKATEETRSKISEGHKGKQMGSSNPMFGVRRFGKDNPMYGKSCWRRGKKFSPLSDEHKRKLSEKGKLRKHTPEELIRMSEAQKKAWIIRKQKKVA